MSKVIDKISWGYIVNSSSFRMLPRPSELTYALSFIMSLTNSEYSPERWKRCTGVWLKSDSYSAGKCALYAIPYRINSECKRNMQSLWDSKYPEYYQSEYLLRKAIEFLRMEDKTGFSSELVPGVRLLVYLYYNTMIRLTSEYKDEINSYITYSNLDWNNTLLGSSDIWNALIIYITGIELMGEDDLIDMGFCKPGKDTSLKEFLSNLTDKAIYHGEKL